MIIGRPTKIHSLSAPLGHPRCNRETSQSWHQPFLTLQQSDWYEIIAYDALDPEVDRKNLRKAVKAYLSVVIYSIEIDHSKDKMVFREREGVRLLKERYVLPRLRDRVTKLEK